MFNHSAAYLAAHVSMPAAPAADADLLGWAEGLTTDVSSLFVLVAKAIILGGIAYGLFRAKMGFAASIGVCAVGALLWWFVGAFNTDDVQNKIDGTVTSAPAATAPATGPDHGWSLPGAAGGAA